MQKDGEPSVEDILRSIKKVISREDDGQAPRGIGPQVGYTPSFAGSRAFGQRDPYARDAYPREAEDAPPAAPEGGNAGPFEATPAEDVYDLGELADEPLTPQTAEAPPEPADASTALPDAPAAALAARPEPWVSRNDAAVAAPVPASSPTPEVPPEAEREPVAGPAAMAKPAAAAKAAAPIVDEGLVAGAAAAAMRDQLAALSTMTARASRAETPAHPLEDLVRDMLRPLLKDWLDQNLQGIVERSVQEEIARISGRR